MNIETQEKELKPCPFCGGKAAFYTAYSEYKNLYYLQVRCRICHASSTTYFMQHEAGEREIEGIIDRWNMRKEAPE